MPEAPPPMTAILFGICFCESAVVKPRLVVVASETAKNPASRHDRLCQRLCSLPMVDVVRAVLASMMIAMAFDVDNNPYDSSAIFVFGSDV